MDNNELAVEDVQKHKQPFHAWALDWIETIVMAFVIVTVVFTFAARVVTVDGASMEPNYYDGDRVLVTSLAGEAKAGDVVIIVHALEETLIKRVVATEGQVVDFDNELGELIVDGQVVNGEVYGTRNGITFAPENVGDTMDFPQTVPEGCVFVLGDHRDDSTAAGSSQLAWWTEGISLGVWSLTFTRCQKLARWGE